MAKQRTSPTQKAGALLKRLGYVVGITEKWNHHVGVRQDLFGFVDLIALKAGATPLYLQVTSWSGVSERTKKITEEGDDSKGGTRIEAARILCASPSARVEVWGFKPGRAQRTKHNLKRRRITYDPARDLFDFVEIPCHSSDLKARA